MNKDLLFELSESVSQITKKASESVMDIYLTNRVLHEEKFDGSPLTEADLSSNRVILGGLKKLGLNFPILSEEGKNTSEENIETFWLVDPLDGTKEFLNRSDEFTINIALIHKGLPVLGVVNAPAKEEMFIGISGLGSYKISKGTSNQIFTNNIGTETLRITVSRNHQDKNDITFIEKAKKIFKNVDIIAAGSSIKLCRVAEGKADIYCRMGMTYQWDIASGQAVVESAGGIVKSLKSKRLKYKFNSAQKNPSFYAVGDQKYDFKQLII